MGIGGDETGLDANAHPPNKATGIPTAPIHRNARIRPMPSTLDARTASNSDSTQARQHHLLAEVMKAPPAAPANSKHQRAVLHVLDGKSSAVRLSASKGRHPLGEPVTHALLNRPTQTYVLNLDSGVHYPDEQWQWFGVADGDSQWVPVSLIDIDRDESGKAAGEIGVENSWNARSPHISYGATTLGIGGKEFVLERIEPFEGLTQALLANIRADGFGN
ncbi:hypothetical protein [Cryobacterium sp. M23]|uniref:hypothetical protein n=1 Tax=Cryobacterium sp. M23 TaxID=2048292 RepID=UPI0011B01E2C|nr:hypothetical protein [Cryobacterium sp. M23]